MNNTEEGCDTTWIRGSHLRVQDIMTRKPLACSTTDSVRDVARLMRDKGVGFVVVLRAGKVAGILTDRQLAVRVLAEEVDPQDLKAQDVMSHDPAMVKADDDLTMLLETMRIAGVVRRVPVVNEQKELVGVVSISDISVVARQLLDAVMLEETRHALSEVRVPSGGKAVRKQARKRRPPATTTAGLKPVTASSIRPRRVPAYSG